MKIYLVIEYGGQYEDGWEKVVCAYENKQEAYNHKEDIDREIETDWERSDKCSKCTYWEDETKPDCFVPEEDDADGCANECLFQITFDRIGSYVKAVEFVQKSQKTGRWKQTKAYPNLIFCNECGEPFEKVIQAINGTSAQTAVQEWRDRYGRCNDISEHSR